VAGLDLLEGLIAKARQAGAEAADVLHVESAAISVAQRLGKPEKLEREESHDLGLRVLIGRRQAVVSTTDLDRAALDALVERAIAMARSVPEDPYCGLADPAELAREMPELDIADPEEPSAEELTGRAAAAEDAARRVPGVTNSEGGEASWSRSRVLLAASNGFAGGYNLTRHGVSASVLAGSGTEMERDYDFSSAVHGSDLEDPAAVGRRAGERAVRRLHPRKAATMQAPVVYDPRVAGGILGHLASAINGAGIARGTSFLKDRLGQQVFSKGVTVTDDPHRRRGLRSKPFDGEGVANRRRALVEDGVLTTWLLDLRSARQLGLSSTGHAARGTGGPPGPAPTNLWLEPGPVTPAELIEDIAQGLFVTELIGFGVNGITGDYSRGAAGFWIENGEIAHPVSEVTVAGNLIEMFGRLSAASDLSFRTGMDAPTLRIDGMTIAGR
jgi:PmbA protein